MDIVNIGDKYLVNIKKKINSRYTISGGQSGMAGAVWPGAQKKQFINVLPELNAVPPLLKKWTYQRS
jgi:hypothetical protein